MSEHRVANAAQAKLLLDVNLRTLQMFLMTAPRTVSEVARHLSVNLNRAYYLITKLEAAGLVQLEGTQARAGRAVKRYQMWPAWFVPFEVMEAETYLAFGKAQMIPRFERLIELGVNVVEGHTTGRPGYWIDATSSIIGDEKERALSLWLGDEPFYLGIGRLGLKRERASEFKKRLLALLDEFREEDAGEPEYTLGLLFVRGRVD